MSVKEYKIGEVFRHTDGKVYQCVEAENCKVCAFGSGAYRCAEMCCGPRSRTDGRSVSFTEATKLAEGMLYRAENGRMYRLTQGSHWDHQCACDDDNSLSCGALDTVVFGGALLGWYWAPVEEDAPAPVDPPKSVESPKSPEPSKRHIELSVVMVEDDEVTFKIVDQTHRNGEFSQQANTDEFKACNGIALASFSFPHWAGGESTLFCRGYRDDKDNNRLTCTAVEFARICEAVADYNETDGKGCEPRWPQEGDRYFYVTAFGTIDHLVFYRHKFSQRMQAFGNFFRTEAEAKAALERVKQALKGNDDLW